MHLKTEMEESLSYLFYQIQIDSGIKVSPSINALLGEFTGHCSSAHMSPLASCRESYFALQLFLSLLHILQVSPSMTKPLTFTSQLSHVDSTV